MNLKKPAHIAFLVSAIITLFVAMFLEKFALIYVQPFTVLSILAIYFTEKKGPASIWYVLSEIIGLVGGILLILGMRYYMEAVSILFSLFYIIYLRLMYVRNSMKKGEIKAYIYVFLIAIPILYIYYNVIHMIYTEIKHVLIYFGCLMFFMLSYIFTALYYYLKKKTLTNLWMLTAAINLGFMNIIIGLNEFYMYEAFFTVIIALCSFIVQYFVLKFMLYNNEEEVTIFL